MYSDLSKFTLFYFEYPALFCAIPALSFPKSLTIKGPFSFPHSACTKLFFLLMPSILIAEVKNCEALLCVSQGGYVIISYIFLKKRTL